MRIALYVTCLVDLMRPSVGFAALRLLEATGAEVVVPEAQTCCGQPAWSAGNDALARSLAQKAIEELDGFERVVVPSGSCAEHLIRQVPRILADSPEWRARAESLAARCRELSVFLLEAGFKGVASPGFRGCVTVHDACKGLRGLGIQAQPRQLLDGTPGVQRVEMAEPEACCGFGGAFSIQFGEISTQIVDRKCAAIAATGAEAVVAGDVGCLLNIEGRLRRRGDMTTRVLHWAEVLAGEDIPS